MVINGENKFFVYGKSIEEKKQNITILLGSFGSKGNAHLFKNVMMETGYCNLKVTDKLKEEELIQFEVGMNYNSDWKHDNPNGNIYSITIAKRTKKTIWFYMGKNRTSTLARRVKVDNNGHEYITLFEKTFPVEKDRPRFTA